ncbi:hypothetical protein BLS_005067 [Venturia inaequalis]|uniref:Early meiotic induction protein 1 n=1 Tax=Venturia inaequalis TaxID=5025 RepID=A0A8H3Z9S9_VENIN|nr:hypothetical protein BLS_005067 [Venturia inaequalis]KAE9986151.1 hypothetical protein EG328_006413 [Venturia inaequalis]KAE9990954.1 hypothetical protein EG327_000725 [Venturia inaequalis]
MGSNTPTTTPKTSDTLPEPPTSQSLTPTNNAEPKSRTQEEELGDFMPIFNPSNWPQQPPEPSLQISTESTKPSPKITQSDSIAPFPTTMSCRDTFDRAFYCQSFGGQFNNVYRYGELKDCKIHWSEFWFCMRIKNKSKESKAELIQDWYRKREGKYKKGPSSEDVWSERKVRLERAFDMDPDEAGIFPPRKGER